LDHPRWNPPHHANRINHKANGLAVKLYHDDARRLIIGAWRHANTLAPADDGDDLATQVNHTLNEGRGLGHPRDGHHADDLLQVVDVDPELFIRQTKGHKLEHFVSIDVRGLMRRLTKVHSVSRSCAEKAVR